jgi:uncharacterized protein
VDAAVSIGDPVAVAFEDIADGVAVPAFVLAPPDADGSAS